MLRYGALIAAAAFAAVPADAQQMDAREARAFVVGKLFSYQCFEGTRGAGRIMENGSVAGTIQFRGNGSTRYAVLPANTLRVVGDRVCASVKGVPFQPCFNLIRTSANTFRGSVSGLGFAYCDFVRRDRPVVAAVEPRGRQAGTKEPMNLQPNRAAFPKPIDSKDLPAVDDDEADDQAADAKTPADDKPGQDKTPQTAAAPEKNAETRRIDSAAIEPRAAAEETTGSAKPADTKSVDTSARADDKPALRPTKD